MKRLILLGFVLSVLLGLRFLFFYKTQPNYRVGQEVILTKTLLTEPQVAGKIQKFYINGIQIILPHFPEYHYGDQLTISGRLEERVIISQSRKNSILMLYFPKAEKNPPSGGLALTQVIRQKIVTVFEKSLPPTQSSLLLGIVFGFRETLDRELVQNLRMSGTLHVVAASGMNVTMVAGFISMLFGSFLRRQIALSFSIGAIIFYALLAGFEPGISFLALILGRQNWALFSLFMTGTLMLLLNPGNILDIGFQLSFLATLGLIIIKPVIDIQILFKNIKRYQIGEDFATTLAAQLATMPILLANFGSFSLFSIFANALVLWTIPPMMVIGGLAAFLALIAPFIAKLVLMTALPLLLFFEKVIALFAVLGGQLKLENLPLTVSLGYYLILASLVLFLKRPND
ncbi:ComEC/Rec2 family competence protein [Candidatus Microgenomates bacterium]|nr:ComEC/Rec2 family competence protein [Candidatus Microgenomates bacterium]